MEFGRQMFQTTVIRADHAIAASTLRRPSATKVIAISEWHVQQDDVEVKVEKDEYNWEPGCKYRLICRVTSTSCIKRY